MLQLLDDGQVTDSKGTKVDFKNCIVIFTSNIGSQDIIELGGADQALMKERVMNAMRANVSRYCSSLSSVVSHNITTDTVYFNPEVSARISEQNR
jgi:ATP-dependent Clp protease ATP-binding subunit ClpA